MIDLQNLGKYTENNRIEAKKAVGGLPKSIWETYSAFANTLGGVILLGVEKLEDKTLSPVLIADPEDLVEEFKAILNNPQKVSVNILAEDDIKIEQSKGYKIVLINVPKAKASEKPVYIDNNPYTGTYRRNGDGDYKCTRTEVKAMIEKAFFEKS